LGPPESKSWTHHDRFSRFCRAHGPNRQTDKPCTQLRLQQ